MPSEKIDIESFFTFVCWIFEAEIGIWIAGVTGRDTTSCKLGNIWGVFKLSSFIIFEENTWGVFRVSVEIFGWISEFSAHVDGIGATADEQEAVLSRFNAKAASNGFEEAMVDDDWGVFCIVDPVPIDAFCANDSVIRYSDLL